MFPSCNTFADLVCPAEANCPRAYCPFWHPPPGEALPQPSTSSSSVSSSVKQHSNNDFYGYTGFVADTPKPSLYAPEDPLAFSGYVASTSQPEEPPRVLSPASPKKVSSKTITSLPLPKVTKDPTALMNYYMDEVTKINRKIEELKKSQNSEKAPEPINEERPKMEAKKDVTIPKAVPGYIPTPISHLKKMQEEKKAKERRKSREEVLVDSLFEDDDNDFVEPKEKKPKMESVIKKKTEQSAGKVKKDRPSVGTVSSVEPADSRGEPADLPGPSRIARQANVDVSASLAQVKAKIRGGLRAVNDVVVAPKKTISALQKRQETIASNNYEASQRKKAPQPPDKKRPLTEGEKIAMLHMDRTAGCTVGKGEARKAHTDRAPSSQSTKAVKPTLLDPFSTKVPKAVRNTFLEKFFQHFASFLSSREEAARNAELEEKSLLDKSNSKNGYQCAGVNTLKRLRDAASTEKNQSDRPKVSHSAVLAGRHVNDISIGVNRAAKNNKPSRVNEAEMYERLRQKYLMNEEELSKNGYPRWADGDRKLAIIEQSEMEKHKKKKCFAKQHDLLRCCSRCTKEFRLHKEGQVMKEECIYHFGRIFKKRVNRAIESRYSCCDSDNQTDGCCVANAHVFDTLLEADLSQFVSTPPPSGTADPRSKKVYAMDCEMVYTVWGPALARVSVVNVHDDLVLDVIVRPPHDIIDANTRFSGLTVEQIETSTHSLRDAQERLFELVNSETILIGHSLESDLKAMRIIHSCVVDTSLVFPHRNGPPFKRALRNLAGEILYKIIQEDLNGHDSKEDSSACMQLMLHKLREDRVPSAS